MRRTRLRQRKTVAVGCDRLPEAFHGKEGVDGSSPSEGSKSPCKKQFSVVGVDDDRALVESPVSSTRGAGAAGRLRAELLNRLRRRVSDPASMRRDPLRLEGGVDGSSPSGL